MNNPLVDKEFLAKLDAEKNREIYAKIIALTFDENPTEQIQGKVTGGSINIDGKSAIRRTCSLTLVASDINISDYYWGLNTKFELFIGMKNDIDSRYDDIIWFKQGIYLITSFNTSLQANSYTISISGKDKMCLLNGDLGGMIESVTADFGTYDEIQEDGTTINKDYLIREIILEGVHHYGREPFHNIIIEDLDDEGLELMEYRGDVDLYLLLNKDEDRVSNMRFNDDTDENLTYYYYPYGTTTRQSIKITSEHMVYDSRLDNMNLNIATGNQPTEVYATASEEDTTCYTVAKITYGDTCGYRLTDLTYAGDLILSTGDKFTSVLDKLVKMLGEYEYFYDLDGHFVFRRKATYVNNSWNNIKSDGENLYVDSAEGTSSFIYSFTNSQLVSSFQNTPNLSNLKNDFSIWGKRDNDTQMHLRYAIDKKPGKYITYKGETYISTEIFKEKYLTTIETSGFNTTANNINLSSDDWWEICDWLRQCLYYADSTNEYDINYYLDLSDTDLLSMFESTKFVYADNTLEYHVFQLICSYIQECMTTWTDVSNLLNSSMVYSDEEGIIYSSDIKAQGKKMWTYLLGTKQIDSQEVITTFCSDYIASEKIPDDNIVFNYHLMIPELLQIRQQGYHIYIYKPQLPECLNIDEDTLLIKDAQSQQEKEITTLSNAIVRDWREIIYQMAIDYFKYGHNDDFLTVIGTNNQDNYPSGYTKYEQYYTDMEGFWRYIYNPDIEYIDITDNSTPDLDQTYYYLWNHDEQNFTEYSFNKATKIKNINDTDKDLYYTYGTRSTEVLLGLINAENSDIVKSDNALYIKTDDDGNQIYSCYHDTNNNTIYELIKEDVYQIYKKYHKYDENENYYQYGLALDLTDLSNTKTYYYPQTITNNSGEEIVYYAPGDKVYLQNEFVNIGNVNEAIFDSRTQNFYIKNGDNYIIADTWNSTDNYYKAISPTNFNIPDTDYYEYQGYAPTSSIQKGNTYYIKDDTSYLRCKNVKSKNDFMEKIDPTILSVEDKQNLLAGGLLYSYHEEPIYTLENSTSYNENLSYFIKDDSSNYIKVDIDNPENIYYYQTKKLIYSVDSILNYIDNDEENPLYYRYYKQWDDDLTEEQFEDQRNNHGAQFYIFTGYDEINTSSLTNSDFSSLSQIDTGTLKEEYYYLDTDMLRVTDPDENASTHASKTRTYYMRIGDTDTYEEVDATTISNEDTKPYYIKFYTYTLISELEYEAGKYYYFDDTTGKPILATGSYSDSLAYHRRDVQYYPIYPNLCDHKDNFWYNNIGNQLVYYTAKEDNYISATSYEKDTYYYIKQTVYTMVGLTSSTYKDNTYWYFTDNPCVPKKATGGYSYGRIYHTRKDVYILVPNLTEDTFNSNPGKYYKRSVALSETTDLSQNKIYYVRFPVYKKIDETIALSNDTTYYKKKFEKVSLDTAYDKQQQYYYLTYKPIVIDEDSFNPFDFYTGEFEPEIASISNPTDDSITYYKLLDDDEEITTMADIMDDNHIATIYFPNKYYTIFNQQQIYTPITENSIETLPNPCYKKNITLSFDIIDDNGNTSQELGYFGDNIHNFYLKVEGKYIEQLEYNSNKKNNYYISNYYSKAFTVYNTDYIDSTVNAITQNFIRGRTYINSDNIVDTFTYGKTTKYYIYVGYIPVKNTDGLDEENTYLDYNKGTSVDDFTFYPPNIYYGYLKVKPEDVTNGYYYIKDPDTCEYTKVNVLCTFERDKKYYTHEAIVYTKVDASNISWDFKDRYYYLDNNYTYISCWEKAQEIFEDTLSLSDVMERLQLIYDTTGFYFQVNNTEKRMVSISKINANKEYYLGSCGMVEFNYLLYNLEFPEGQHPHRVYLSDEFNPEDYWTMDRDNPQDLPFWIDFMDTSLGSNLSQYGADSIGSRPKSVNDQDVKAIYYRDIPNIIFVNTSDISTVNRKTGYEYLQLTDNIDNLFQFSAQGKTAYDMLDTYLQDYSYCTESITISIIPVYYLEPNVRILVYDENSGINGEYIINKLTIPLSYNGLMSITATKAIDRIY